MMKIREEIAANLKTRIGEGQWDEAFNRLGITGKLTMREAWNIILILCKHIEKLEDEKTAI